MPISFAWSDLQQEFLSLYPLRDSYICKLPGQDRWKTWTGPLQDHQIIGVMQDGGRGILRGCHWAEKTRFAVLDIDELSQYHNQESLAAIAQALRSIGLNFALYRSSEGGGWHCYLSFSCWEKSKDVENTLKLWLKHLGYELKGGQLEVFPSGNALRLPLQPGFAWLDFNNCIIRRREEISFDEALAFFLQDLEDNAADWVEAKSRIESQLATNVAAAGSAHQKAISNEGFDELFNYRVIQEHCEKARKYLGSGLTEKGTRHEAIYTIQHLLWHGDVLLGVPRLPGRKNAGRRYQFLRDWIAQNHNGKCSHIEKGDWRTIEAHIYRVVNWQRADLPALSNYEPYRATQRSQERLFELFMATGRVWEMSDLKKANEDREEDARNKIKRAVGDCLQQGRQISRKTLQAITGCSPNTIRKHGDLWRLFAAGSGVLISGGGGASACFDLLNPNEIEEPSLTPFVRQDQGDEWLTASESQKESLPNSESLTAGSSLSSGSPVNACGISSLTLLAPVILGNFSYGARSKPTPAIERCKKLIYRVMADTGG